MGYVIQAVLSNAQHPEYGQITIPFPIPKEEYDHTIELLEPLGIGDTLRQDCKVDDLDKIAEGLPELCFSTLRTTGQLICIKRGETGYYPSEWDTGDKERNVELADELNKNLGVSPIQRQAMEVGSMAGWDVPGADPAKYQENYPKMGGISLG